MTKIKKIITLVILLMISFVIFNTNNYKSVAETTNVSNKKKIVSVVFDNSGSMIASKEEQRENFALYSLQMLIGLLDKEDTLFINGESIKLIGNKAYYIFEGGNKFSKLFSSSRIWIEVIFIC